jgi:hypothetical protein
LGIPTGQGRSRTAPPGQTTAAGQVVVKLFLPYPLHAKLYLLFRDDVNNPITGFVGSSNLTMSGLSNRANSTSMCWITWARRSCQMVRCTLG